MKIVSKERYFKSTKSPLNKSFELERPGTMKKTIIIPDIRATGTKEIISS